MTARKKTPKRETPVAVNLDTTGMTDADRETIEKDHHLLQAALSADRIIVTRDDSFRRALGKTPQGAQLLRSIRWINPVKNATEEFKHL
jgi:predicted nuclease of predicted toxin-antitoxin system